jgi:hypothetical protein
LIQNEDSKRDGIKQPLQSEAVSKLQIDAEPDSPLLNKKQGKARQHNSV